MLAAIAIPAGLLIGLSLGALGGGGSILTVPALVYLLGLPPHAATTGSLLIVGITALAGMVAHWRAGRVRIVQGVVFGTIGIVGSYVGTRLSASIRPDLLLALFAVLMLVAATAMLRRRRSAAVDPGTAGPHPGEAEGPHPGDGAEASGSPLAADRPGGSATSASAGQARTVTLNRPAAASGPDADGERRNGAMRARRALKVIAAATAVGLLTGFFGVGGGFVIVPALVLALDFEMPAAIGTSLLVIAINSAASLGARFGGGIHLDWPLLGVFTLAALAGAVGGNRVASRVSPSRLTVAFTVLLFAVAAYTLARSLPGLL